MPELKYVNQLRLWSQLIFEQFSINSDDPSYFSDLIDNYFALQEAFKFTKDTWRQLMIDAIEGSWCDEMRKKELLREVEAMMVKYADVQL